MSPYYAGVARPARPPRCAERCCPLGGTRLCDGPDDEDDDTYHDPYDDTYHDLYDGDDAEVWDEP